MINDLRVIKEKISLSDLIGKCHKLKLEKVDEYKCLCPFHNERTPSFHIYDKTGRYFCFGCEVTGDIFDWLAHERGMSIPEAKIFIEGAPSGAIKQTVVTKEIIPIPTQIDNYKFRSGYSYVHYYRNSAGDILYKVARYETTGEDRKTFRPATHTSNGWVPNAPTSGRVIYGLDRLTAISDGVVILVAGEKKCDQLQKLLPNNPVISWMGGDSAFHKTDWVPIKNRKIIFWPDNDAGCIVLSAKIIAAKLWIVPIPDGTPPKWDCGDAIESGWNAEQITAFLKNKILYTPIADIKKNPSSCIENAIDIVPCINKPLSELLKNTPGIVGRIAKWIGETAEYPFPGLEFAAAAVTVGVAMGHRYCSETNVRTNLYIAGFAGASSGKDYARKAIAKLLDAAGESILEIGVPKSGSGLRSALKGTCKGVILWDEIGLRFQGISGHGAGSHLLEIFELLMQAYTSADGKLMGEQYANRDGTMTREDIYQPCLGLYGTSTRESFYDSMNSKLALNGFMPRWLVIEDNLPYRIGRKITGKKNPPTKLVEEFKALCEKPIMFLDQNNNDYLRNHEPEIIPFDNDARELLYEFEKQIVDKQNNEALNAPIPTDIFRAIWGRAWVNAVKICLVCKEADTISLPIAEWAIALVSCLTNNMIADLSKYVSDNQHEAAVKRLMDIIRKNNGLTREELTYKSRWVRDSRHRDDIIKTLIDSELIEMVKEPTDSGRPRERFYLK